MTSSHSLTISTPIGRLLLIANQGVLIEVSWESPKTQEKLHRPSFSSLESKLEFKPELESELESIPKSVDPILDIAARQINEWFKGLRRDFDLPLSPIGTSFQSRVWNRLRAIPYGQTVTYGALAEDLGSSARAIGGACGRNPIPLIIPCHRVVSVTGLGGYSGMGWLTTKKFLLDHEARQKGTFP
jgi:methylated-DNA-[protein]-cysteine S-methyltransferase